MAKRRANGEGSIRKRKDGRWEGRFTAAYDSETGKQIFKNVLGKTQAEVKEKLKKAMEEGQGLDVIRSGQYTVAGWMRLWFETYSKPSLREASAENYRNYIENHIIPHIGEIKLNKLTSLDIQRMYNETKTSGRVQRYKDMKDLSVSNRLVRGMHMVLHGCLDQAMREGLLTKNPTNDCKISKLEKKEMKIIPPEQVGAYLKEAENHGVLPMFYLELTSGLWRGELLALLWNDLDIKNRSISVSKQVNAFKGELKVSRPKTENSIRTIVIPQKTVDLLIEEHAKHPDNPYMFPSPVTGGMYHPDAVGRIHKKILKSAGIQDIRFHDLRHTFATLAINSGADIKTLLGMLGHFSAGFTLDTYTHATRKMQMEAADKLGAFVEQVSKRRKIETQNAEKPHFHAVFPINVVGVTGFEPAASKSQTSRATNCATPRFL